MLRCFQLLVVLKRIGNKEIDYFAFYKIIEVYVSFFGTKVFPNQFSFICKTALPAVCSDMVVRPAGFGP